MLRQLKTLENSGLLHTQTGFSMIEKDHNMHALSDYTIFSVNYKNESMTGLNYEIKVPMMNSNYWCAIESTSSAEVIPFLYRLYAADIVLSKFFFTVFKVFEIILIRI